MSFDQVTMRLGNWLEAFAQPVILATDSLSWDWPWVQELLSLPGTWPANLEPRPLILKQTPEFCRAVENAFAAGLRRHHALDDAKANRLGWLQEERRDPVR